MNCVMDTKILQINVTANSGSTGRIAEGIGLAVQNAGFESWIAYGRYANKSRSQLIRIGSTLSCYEHGFESRIFDNHGLASRIATTSFIKKIDQIQPDLIHIHNIHGYYINYKILFRYIREKSIPVVWTFHDCWPFTGHCSYFTFCGCEKWKSACFCCPQKKAYPASFFLDRSKKNYEEKKKAFSSFRNLTLVSVSHWLDQLVSESFFRKYNHITIHNGIDTEVFTPCSNAMEIRRKYSILDDETMLLGVAKVWNYRKGLNDFIELGKLLSPKEKIILIGLSKDQISSLPPNIIGLGNTESARELAEYYSAADLFLNLTYEDNYPTTNLEAISCGTPCLTYRTGGSPESITDKTGFVIEQGNIQEAADIISGKGFMDKKYGKTCRSFAENIFSEKVIFQKYIELYQLALENKSFSL